MFVHVEFRMILGDYPIMMGLRADFEEDGLWNKLGLALQEGASPGAFHPNYYIDKVRGHIHLHHPDTSWDIHCTDLNGQVWSLRYLRPGENPGGPQRVLTLHTRTTKNHLAVTRRSRYKRDPVI